MKSLLLVFLIAAASAQNCLDSADRLINGRCFKFVSQQLSYQDARNWCHYNNPVTYSYLATVSDTTTSNFLASYARTIFNTNEGSFWIGLNKYNTSSRFQWDDGTPVSWTNFQEPKSMNYVAESMINGKWSTYGSDSKFNFVCSYDPNGSPTRGTTENLTDKPTTNWMTTNEATPTPTATTDCTPATPTTFLFAYSNDLDPNVVSWTFDHFKYINNHNSNSVEFSSFANVRFDLSTEDEISFHTTYGDWYNSVHSFLPNPKLGFQDSSTGSDVLKTINKFLKNSQVPVCGSKILILLKRYPNDIDISGPVSQLRKHHSYVTMITSNSPSGGLYRDTMNNLTSMTNGFSVYCYDEKFSRTVQSLPTYDYTSLMYAANVRLSTSGYIPIPQMDTYHYYYQWLFMTIQDHGPLDQYQFSNITWYGRGVYNEKDNNNCCYTTKSDVLVRYGNTNIITAAFDFAPGPYDMYVKVQFADNIKELVQIRFYSYKDAIDHWIPYED